MATPVLYVAEPTSVRLIDCSPPSWACQMAMVHKEVPCDVRPLDFRRGEHRSDEMLRLNRRGTIPVLVDGEQAVHETMAILSYVEMTWPEPALLPASQRARALTRFHETASLKDACMPLLAWLMRSPPEEHTSEAVQERGGAVLEELEHWEVYLSRHAWAADDEPTLADCLLAPYVAVLVRLGLALEVSFPSVAAYAQRLGQWRTFEATTPPGWRNPSHSRPLIVLR